MSEDGENYRRQLVALTFVSPAAIYAGLLIATHFSGGQLSIFGFSIESNLRGREVALGVISLPGYSLFLLHALVKVLKN